MEKNYCINLCKSGKFYSAYGDDALILHYLTGYKYVEPKKLVGFPETALAKVKAKLDNEDLPYKLYDKNDLTFENKGINRKYQKILKKAIEAREVNERVERLREKVNNLSLDKLEMMLEMLEDESI